MEHTLVKSSTILTETKADEPLALAATYFAEMIISVGSKNDDLQRRIIKCICSSRRDPDSHDGKGTDRYKINRQAQRQRLTANL
jgi:hypothetical protein